MTKLAGEDNPHVKTTEANLTAEFGAQQEAMMKNLQEDMERQLTHREQVAVANAVQRMVAHLSGVSTEEIDINNLLASIPAKK